MFLFRFVLVAKMLYFELVTLLIIFIKGCEFRGKWQNVCEIIYLPKILSTAKKERLNFQGLGEKFRLDLNRLLIDDITMTMANKPLVNGHQWTGTVNNDSQTSTIYGQDENGLLRGCFVWNNKTYSLNNVPDINNTYLCHWRHSCSTISVIEGRNLTTFFWPNKNRYPLISAFEKSLYSEYAPIYLCSLTIIGDSSFSYYVDDGNPEIQKKRIIDLITKVNEHFPSFSTGDKADNDIIQFYIENLILTTFGNKVPANFFNKQDRSTLYSHFKQTTKYSFGDSCGGLIFTFRRDFFPCIYPTLTEQGICSEMKALVPLPWEDNMDRYFTKVLPVNFAGDQASVASDDILVARILHQLGHLFGALDDYMFTDEECQSDPTEPFASASVDFRDMEKLKDGVFSPCALYAMKQFLEINGRPCLKACYATRCVEKYAKAIAAIDSPPVFRQEYVSDNPYWLYVPKANTWRGKASRQTVSSLALLLLAILMIGVVDI